MDMLAHDWTGPTLDVPYPHCRRCGEMYRLSGRNPKRCSGEWTDELGEYLRERRGK